MTFAFYRWISLVGFCVTFVNWATSSLYFPLQKVVAFSINCIISAREKTTVHGNISTTAREAQSNKMWLLKGSNILSLHLQNKEKMQYTVIQQVQSWGRRVIQSSLFLPKAYLKWCSPSFNILLFFRNIDLYAKISLLNGYLSSHSDLSTVLKSIYTVCLIVLCRIAPVRLWNSQALNHVYQATNCSFRMGLLFLPKSGLWGLNRTH